MLAGVFRQILRRKKQTHVHGNWPCCLQIHVVEETRMYQSWSRDPSCCTAAVDLSFGINAGRQMLNNLHYELAKEGYKEVKFHEYIKELTSAGN
jgi:hypothetical protein